MIDMDIYKHKGLRAPLLNAIHPLPNVYSGGTQHTSSSHCFLDLQGSFREPRKSRSERLLMGDHSFTEHDVTMLYDSMARVPPYNIMHVYGTNPKSFTVLITGSRSRRGRWSIMLVQGDVLSQAC
ncbi:hypothetical protein SERLA73DRAFT_187471 [Serpula lacrymans var. lacrymans S7.3]|uniref:Uncharacterized protein n=2 Tax=Serpula lacrymans var. lacrymans TaxID=341189 RepID=F8Q993_SERL3|nr:uncharacterized protein SERLADRAFT_399758 [Serpula lacrymans var. lacrymans S7.9]EGN95148.1 hypothetical protein SERLA73DRAFT_187471 [Serpula lacrymans var. lacrymans S7.3]EGO20660.1 hypothetical protein SERLADRAFT_399758 [Serpula lacrymans var. lacrymans S7.9]